MKQRAEPLPARYRKVPFEPVLTSEIARRMEEVEAGSEHWKTLTFARDNEVH